MGLFGDKELDKTGDVNANLWAGLALVVVARCSSLGRGSGRSSCPTTSTRRTRPALTRLSGQPSDAASCANLAGVDDHGVDGALGPVEVDGQRAAPSLARSRASRSGGGGRTASAGLERVAARRTTRRAAGRRVDPQRRHPGRGGCGARARPSPIRSNVSPQRRRRAASSWVSVSASCRRRSRVTVSANGGASPPSAKPTNSQASARARNCASQKTPDGTAVRTVTVAPSWTACPPAGRTRAPAPRGSQDAGRPEQDVVALVLEQLLGLAPVEREQRRHRLRRWPVGQRGAHRDRHARPGRWPRADRSRRRSGGAADRALQRLVHQRVGVVGPADPLALLEQHLVDVGAGLALGAAEQDGMLDQPAVPRRDVLVEVHGYRPLVV